MTAEQPSRNRVDWTHFWVLAGAMASGGFLVLILITFLGAYYFRVIPAPAIEFIANHVWAFVCLTYVILQVIPMIVRYQTQGWDVGIDQITTIIATMGTVVVIAGWFFNVMPIDSAGWQIFFLTILTNIFDFLLLLSGNKMIAAARGAEDKKIG